MIHRDGDVLAFSIQHGNSEIYPQRNEGESYTSQLLFLMRVNLQGCQELDSSFAKSLFYICMYSFFFFATLFFWKRCCWERIGLRGTCAILVLGAFLCGSLYTSHWIKLHDIYYHLIQRPPPPSIYGNWTVFSVCFSLTTSGLQICFFLNTLVKSMIVLVILLSLESLTFLLMILSPKVKPLGKSL